MSRLSGLTVHPHVCGEHPFVNVYVVYMFRFIPTCVGNMNVDDYFIAPLFGSSPRVWGTFQEGLAWRLRHRFIPTCVGNI